MSDPVNEFDLDGRICGLAAQISVIGFLYQKQVTAQNAAKGAASEIGQRAVTRGSNWARRVRPRSALIRWGSRFIKVANPASRLADVLAALCTLARSGSQQWNVNGKYVYRSGSEVSPHMSPQGVPLPHNMIGTR